MAEPSKESLSQVEHGIIKEDFPFPIKINNEEILNHNRTHNAWIIIGRDRPQGKESGYGQFDSKLGQKCTTIDIVVGRYSHKSGGTHTIPGEGTKKFDRNAIVGNNIQEDASRIYISQKTDIDKNFIIERAGTLKPAYGKAAIGIKSDNLRFVARESIKIVANSGDVNSLGRRDSSVHPMYGIQLICGSETEAEDVQSIVKSENLNECLTEMMDLIENLYGILNDYIGFQKKFNAKIANHKHIGHFDSSVPGAVKIVEPIQLISAKSQHDSQVDAKTLKSIKENREKLANKIRTTYLNKAKNAKKYIGSMYNKTN